jgi:hypothetical protein
MPIISPAGFGRRRIQFNPGIAAWFLASPDHFVRPRQHVGGNRQADLLRSFKINYEFELCRLLDS